MYILPNMPLLSEVWLPRWFLMAGRWVGLLLFVSLVGACSNYNDYVSGDQKIGVGVDGAAKLIAVNIQQGFSYGQESNPFEVQFVIYPKNGGGKEERYVGFIPVDWRGGIFKGIMRLSLIGRNFDSSPDFIEMDVERAAISIYEEVLDIQLITRQRAAWPFSITIPVDSYQDIVQSYAGVAPAELFFVFPGLTNDKDTDKYPKIPFRVDFINAWRLTLVPTGLVEVSLPWNAALAAIDFEYNANNINNPTGVIWRLSKQGSTAAVLSGTWTCQADGTNCSNGAEPIRLSSDRKTVTIQSDTLVEPGAVYTLTATVSTSEPGSPTYTTSATIVPKDQEPVASIRRVSPDSTIVFGQPVQFDASDSVVPKGSAVVFKYTTLDDLANPVGFPEAGDANGAVNLRPSLSFSKKIAAVYVVISPPNGGAPKSQSVDLSQATYAIALPTGGF